MSLLELLKRAAAQAAQAFRDPGGLLSMEDLWWVALALAGLGSVGLFLPGQVSFVLWIVFLVGVLLCSFLINYLATQS